MTYQALLKRLTDIGSAAPAHEAAEMVRVIAGKGREWCLLNRSAELPTGIDDAVQKREQGMPLQYILGEAWFYANRFIVSPDCLIPQPDTEQLVMLALEYMPRGGRFTDLCTGSGCIAVSILKENPTAVCTAVDISHSALAIAKRNAELHSVADRMEFLEADVLAIPPLSLAADADVIVSNPPYINTDVIDTLSDEVRREPRIALDGGADGMRFYRHFISALAPCMKPDAVMLLEIGYDQAERVAQLCRAAGFKYSLHRDFGKNVRAVELRR